MQSLSNASDEELLSQILPITTVKEIAAEYGTYGHLRQWLANALPGRYGVPAWHWTEKSKANSSGL